MELGEGGAMRVVVIWRRNRENLILSNVDHEIIPSYYIKLTQLHKLIPTIFSLCEKYFLNLRRAFIVSENSSIH